MRLYPDALTRTNIRQYDSGVLSLWPEAPDMDYEVMGEVEAPVLDSFEDTIAVAIEKEARA